MKEVIEGRAKVLVGNFEKISKEMEVFYNPMMRSNRDISVLFIKAYNLLNKGHEIKKVILPFSASGIRGIRFLKELKNLEVIFNDLSRRAVDDILKNLEINNLKADVRNQDCDSFVMQNSFDYVDIDPFGSPNPFLDQAIKHAKHNSILAVTATDLSGLAGTHPKACLRKYWSVPLRNEFMHETGLRILIRKIQLIGSQYEKALFPLLSYYKDHYYRIFFKVQVSKAKVDSLLKLHEMFDFDYNKRSFKILSQGKYGPLYVGKLFNKKLVHEIVELSKEDEKSDVSIAKSTKKFLSILDNELDVFGLYDLHVLKKHNLIKDIPNFSKVDCGKRTIFNPTAFKTTLSYDEFISCINSLFE